MIRIFARLRRGFLSCVARLFAPVLIRLALGRWVKPQGVQWFAEGFVDQSVDMPPLISALLNMPGGRQMIFGAAEYAWTRRPEEWPAMTGSKRFIHDLAAYTWCSEHGRLDPLGTPDLGGDLSTAWAGPPISFLHLEKCGGIAVMRWLTGQFHPLQINTDDHRDLPPHLCYRTPEFKGVIPSSYSLIWGHYDLPTLRRCVPGHLVFTVLRHPCARIISLYNFWRSVDPTQFDPDLSFSVALAHRLTLEEFLICDDPLLLDVTDNLYVRRLTGLYATGAKCDPLQADPEAALQQAITAIDTLFYVGVTEDMAGSMKKLAGCMGIAPPPAGLRGNVGAENHEDPSGWFRQATRAEISPAVEAALQRRTRLDMRLYEHVQAGT